MAIKHENPFRGGCFNVGSDRDNFTVRALTEFLKDRLFSNVPIEEFPEKVDPRSYRVASGRFGKITGFSTERELAEGDLATDDLDHIIYSVRQTMKSISI